MSKRMFLIVSPFLAIVAIGLLLSACGGSSVHVTAKNATLVSIGVTPANPNLPQGLTGQFTATGTYSDNSTQDLTAQVAWSSSNTGVATIDSAGLATSVAAGTTTITATLGLVSENTTLTVTNATLSSIAVTPTNPSIANGTTRQFTATGTYSDFTTQDLTTQVAWSSSAAGVATISNAGGSRFGDIGCGRYNHDHGHLGRCLREHHADRDGREPVNDYSDTDHSEYCERDDPAIHGHRDL